MADPLIDYPRMRGSAPPPPPKASAPAPSAVPAPIADAASEGVGPSPFDWADLYTRSAMERSAPPPPGSGRSTAAPPANAPPAPGTGAHPIPPREIDGNSEEWKSFAALAEKRGLDQGAVDEILGLHTRAMAAHFESRVASELAGWKDRALKDEEIGGDKTEATLATAHSVLKEFGTPELNDMLRRSFVGSHPEIVRLLGRVGKALEAARGKK